MNASASDTRPAGGPDWRRASGNSPVSGNAPVVDSAVDSCSDEALVRALIKHGHRQHADMLLLRYREKIFHIVLSILGPPQAEEAQDLTQDICVRMLQKLRQFRQESQFSTWIYRMAFNAALDHKRKVRRKRQYLRDYAEEPGTNSVTPPAALLSVAQKARAVQSAVDQLPDTQRIVIRMYYWLELSVTEIAELLGTAQNTVKSHLRRARIRLSQQLENT